MSGTAVPFGQVVVPVALFITSGVTFAFAWDNSQKKKIKAFFQLVFSIALFYVGYTMMTTGKTFGNYRSNASAKYSNWQAQRAAAAASKLGPTANVPIAAPGMPPPALAPAAAAA